MTKIVIYKCLKKYTKIYKNRKKNGKLYTNLSIFIK